MKIGLNVDGNVVWYDTMDQEDEEDFLYEMCSDIRDVVGDEPASEEVDDLTTQIFRYELADGSVYTVDDICEIAQRLWQESTEIRDVGTLTDRIADAIKLNSPIEADDEDAIMFSGIEKIEYVNANTLKAYNTSGESFLITITLS